MAGEATFLERIRVEIDAGSIEQYIASVSAEIARLEQRAQQAFAPGRAGQTEVAGFGRELGQVTAAAQAGAERFDDPRAQSLLLDVQRRRAEATRVASQQATGIYKDPNGAEDRASERIRKEATTAEERTLQAFQRRAVAAEQGATVEERGARTEEAAGADRARVDQALSEIRRRRARVGMGLPSTPEETAPDGSIQAARDAQREATVAARQRPTRIAEDPERLYTRYLNEWKAKGDVAARARGDEAAVEVRRKAFYQQELLKQQVIVERSEERAVAIREVLDNEQLLAKAVRAEAELRRVNAERQTHSLQSVTDPEIERNAFNQLLQRSINAQQTISQGKILDQTAENDPQGRSNRELFVQAEGQAAAEKKRQAEGIRRVTQEELSTNQDFIRDQVRANEAERRLATAIEAEALGVQRAAGESDRDFRLRTEATRRLSQAEERAARNTIERQVASQDPRYTEGSVVQRLQQFIAQRQGREPQAASQYLSGGQFLASRLVTTAGFALSGAVLYGGIQSIRQLVDAADKTQLAFSQLKVTFDTLGDSKGFDQARQNVLAVARETGIAIEEVGAAQSRFRSALSGRDQTGQVRPTAEVNQLTNESVRTASQLSALTGDQLTDVVDKLTATQLAYGATAQQVSDEAVRSFDRFGVPIKDTLDLLGQIAPVAEQYGMSLHEIATLAGVAQERSGLSAGSIEQAFQRVIPNVQQHASDIAVQFKSIPGLQSAAPTVEKDLASGAYGRVVLDLAQNFDKLTAGQQHYFATLLGGSRNAAQLMTILQNGQEITDELGKSQDVAGSTAARYAAYQQTVTAAMKELRQQFREIGTDLARAGLAQALSDLAKVGGGLIYVFRGIADALAFFNEHTHGAVVRVGEIVAALKLLQVALKAIADFRRAQVAEAATEEAVQTAATAGTTGGGGILGLLRGATPSAAGARLGSATGRFGSTFEAAQAGQLPLLGGGLGGGAAALAPSALLAKFGGTVARAGTGLTAEQTAAGIALPAEGSALGLGSGSLAFSVGALAVTVAGALLVAHTYNEQKTKIAKVSKSLTDEVKNAPTDALRAEYENLKHAGAGDQFTMFTARNIFRTKDPAQIIQGELTSRDALSLTPQIRALQDVLHIGEKSKTDFNRVLKQAGVSQKDILDLEGVTSNRKGDEKVADIGDLQRRVRAHDELAQKVAAQLLKKIQFTPEQKKALDDAAKGYGSDELNRQIAASPDTYANAAMQTVQTALAAYTSGDPSVTYTNVTKILHDNLTVLQELYQDALKSGDPQRIQDALQVLQQTQQSADQIFTAAEQGNQQLGTLTGNLLPGDIAQRQAQFLNTNRGDLSVDARITGGQQLVQDLVNTRQAQESNALNAANAYAFALGKITPSPDEQSALDQFVQDYKQRTGVDLSSWVSNIITNSTDLDKARRAAETYLLQGQQAENTLNNSVTNGRDPVAKAQTDLDNARLAAAKAQKDDAEARKQATDSLPGAQSDLDAAQKHYDAVQKNLDNADSPQQARNAQAAVDAAQKQLDQAKQKRDALQAASTGPNGDLDKANQSVIDAQNQYNDAQEQVTQSNFQVTQAQTRHDPRKIANLQKQAADQALKYAQDSKLGQGAINAALIQQAQADQSLLDIADSEAQARLSVTAQKDTANRLKSAADQIAQADELAKEAGNDVTKQQEALRARIAAEQNQQQVMDDVANSFTELDIVRTKDRGDPVGAAEKSLALLHTQLDQAKKRGDDQGKLNAILGQIDEAQFGVVDAMIQSTISHVQTNIELGRSSISQGIALLQAKRAEVMSREHTQDQIDQIDLAIKHLQQSSQTAFNIPQGIRLPTAYEVGRFQQTPFGQGYNDNRVVTINMNVTGMNTAEATRLLSDSMGRPAQVYTTASRRI